MKKFLSKFKNIKVLIVGDVMLDQYWWGNVERVSPEAPVPVVHLNKKNYVPGGAANVAANISGLGAKAYLIGVIGMDKEGEKVSNSLTKIGVSDEFLIPIKKRHTTVKTRIIANNQHVVRIDQESSETVNSEIEELIVEKFEALINDVDIVLLSDYAKGVISEMTATRLITKAVEKQKYVIVDPKGRNYSKYKFATVLTPNQKEALDATNSEYQDENSIETTGKSLMKDLCLECLIITRGEKGMTLFQKEKDIENLRTAARKVYDVTGAGDTVIATLTVAVGAGMGFSEAAALANISAGKVVQQVGTTVIKFEDLLKEVSILNLSI